MKKYLIHVKISFPQTQSWCKVCKTKMSHISIVYYKWSLKICVFNEFISNKYHASLYTNKTAGKSGIMQLFVLKILKIYL